MLSALLFASYIFVLMTKRGFEVTFSRPITWQRGFGLWMVYLGLPLLLSLSGVGLLGLSNQEVLKALPPASQVSGSIGETAPQRTIGEIDWGTKVTLGAGFSSILLVAIARVLARACYAKSMTRNAYIAGIASVVLLTSFAFLKARYLEVLFEGVFTQEFLVPFFLLATGVAAMTEAMLRAVAHIEIKGDRDTDIV